MTTVVIEGEGAPAEAISPEDVPPVEVAADAAVEIAEIQADRDITLAAIAAESERERAELWRNDRITDMEAELVSCRTTITTLETALEETKALLILQSSAELEAPPSPPPPPESQSADITDSLEPDVQATLPEEPAKRKRRLRLI